MNPLFHALAVFVLIASLAMPAAAADDALSLVPANAVTVGVVQLSDLRTSALSSLLYQHVDRMSTNGEAGRFLLEAGLRPLHDVDRLIVATSPRTTLGSEPDVLAIAEGRFQPGRLAAALVARGAVVRGACIVFADEDRSDDDEAGAVAFLSPSLAVAGNERSVVNALTAYANGGTGFLSRGALAMDVSRIDRSATAWALIDVPRAARLTKGGAIETVHGPQGATLQSALKSVSTVGFWAKDAGDTLQLGTIALSHDAETLQLLDDAFRGALAAMRVVSREKVPELVPALRRFEVDRRADAISVEGSIPASTLRELIARKLPMVLR